MTDHPMPVVPEPGDAVTIRYRSTRRDSNHDVQSCEATVERVASYTNDDGRVGHHVLAQESPWRYLIATVYPRGTPGYAYSVNFEEPPDDGGEFRVSHFRADGSSWYLSWQNATKTKRVELGKVVGVDFVSAG